MEVVMGTFQKNGNMMVRTLELKTWRRVTRLEKRRVSGGKLFSRGMKTPGY
jgi:hypothetical protein